MGRASAVQSSCAGPSGMEESRERFDLVNNPPEDIYLLSRLLVERLAACVARSEKREAVLAGLRAVDSAVEEPCNSFHQHGFLASPENRCAFLYRFMLSQVTPAHGFCGGGVGQSCRQSACHPAAHRLPGSFLPCTCFTPRDPACFAS